MESHEIGILGLFETRRQEKGDFYTDNFERIIIVEKRKDVIILSAKRVNNVFNIYANEILILIRLGSKPTDKIIKLYVYFPKAPCIPKLGSKLCEEYEGKIHF